MCKFSLVVFVASLTAFAEDLPLNLGKRVHLGGLLGTSITNDVRSSGFEVGILDQSTFAWKRSGNRQLIVGPSFEFDLGRQFSIEADALYHPIEIETKLLPPQYGLSVVNTALRVDNWEFPILGKKYFQLNNWRPFIAAGPSFRTISTYGGPSHFGVTAAAGAEFSWRKLRITPSVRYTHWGDGEGGGEIYRNQSALLVGFSF